MAYRKHFDTLISKDEKGNITQLRELTDRERKWVENERVLCTIDFRYWSSHYGRIKDKANRISYFHPNLAQTHMLNIWGEMEEMEISIMVQILKARQLGMSTLTELAVAHRVQFHNEINAVVASSDPDKSRKMADMMLFSWDHQPWWLMPTKLTGRAGILHEFGNGSAVSIQWGNQATGIARGTTPTVVHLSELADFENPAELVDASLMRAIHDSPFVLVVLESTANGRDNWWHKKWEYAKANWHRGMSRLRPVFLPWYVGTDLYPTPTWLKAHPVPQSYQPTDQVIDHAAAAEEFVSRQPILQKVLGTEWSMPVEQKWFYEANRHQYKSEGILGKWYQEMPADDLEAFQHKRMSIFDAELVAERRHQCLPPIVVCGLENKDGDIPLRLQPTKREINRESPFRPISVNPTRITNQRSNSYKFVPLVYRGISDTDPLGKIFIYELPVDNNEYGVGVDTAYGVGQDRTCVQVIRKATPYKDAAQVAEFASDQMNAFEVWPFVIALATLYSVRGWSGEMQAAKVTIEMAANGEATQMQLMKLGWPLFHIQTKSQVRGQVPTNKTTPLFGWKTTEGTRGPMIDFLLKALRDGWLQINSPWFVDEMGNFIRNEKKERIEAAEGSHDDRLMAMGIILDSMHRSELYREATPSWQTRVADEQAAKTHPVFTYDYSISTGTNYERGGPAPSAFPEMAEDLIAEYC